MFSPVPCNLPLPWSLLQRSEPLSGKGKYLVQDSSIDTLTILPFILSSIFEWISHWFTNESTKDANTELGANVGSVLRLSTQWQTQQGGGCPHRLLSGGWTWYSVVTRYLVKETADFSKCLRENARRRKPLCHRVQESLTEGQHISRDLKREEVGSARSPGLWEQRSSGGHWLGEGGYEDQCVCRAALTAGRNKRRSEPGRQGWIALTATPLKTQRGYIFLLSNRIQCMPHVTLKIVIFTESQKEQVRSDPYNEFYSTWSAKYCHLQLCLVKKVNWFVLCVWVSWLCKVQVCGPCACFMPLEARRGHPIPWMSELWTVVSLHTGAGI